MVEEGEKAPDFELPAHDGGAVSLSSFRGRVVVLCFYPKNRLFGCPSKKVHQMAQSMIAAYPDIAAAGGEVFAVSVDTVQSQANFVREWSIPYKHLSDESKDVCKRYAGLNMARLARRSTFVIDAAGVVRRVFRGFDTERHGAEVLECVRSLD